MVGVAEPSENLFFSERSASRAVMGLVLRSLMFQTRKRRSPVWGVVELPNDCWKNKLPVSLGVPMFWPTSSARGDEGTKVKMVCAGRATSRMRKENGARPDFLTRRMRAPASPDEEIFPSLLFLITCRSILTVRASRATIGKSETSPDGLRGLKRDALRTLGFREDSKVSTVFVCLKELLID